MSDVFVRLHALVRKGYCAELGVGDERVVRLRHPRRATGGAPDLILDADGTLFALDNESPINKGEDGPNAILSGQAPNQRAFEAFIRNLPEPSLLQLLDASRVRDVRIQLILQGIIIFVSFFIVIGSILLIKNFMRFF